MIVTEWNEFKNLDLELIYRELKQPIILDGRNIYDPEFMQMVGFHYRGFGRGYNGERLGEKLQGEMNKA